MGNVVFIQKPYPMKRSITSYLLVILVFIQMISALPAGLSLIIDPSGMGIGLPLKLLEHSPFPDFLIPGLFLFIFLGLLPALVFYGLIKRPIFRALEKLNMFKDYHWSWTYAYYIGVLLILWINMQLFFVKEFGMLHFVYSMLGVLIVFITHLPGTKRDYRHDSIPKY